jgi:hypothetical protein
VPDGCKRNSLLLGPDAALLEELGRAKVPNHIPAGFDRAFAAH